MNNMKKRVLVFTGMLLAIVLVFASACGSGSSTSSNQGSVKTYPGGIPSPTTTTAYVTKTVAPAPAIVSSSGRDYATISEGVPAYEYDSSSASSQDRMIVRNASMDIIVTDVAKARDALAQLAVTYGGFVVSTQINGEDEDMRGWVSLRVVNDKLDQAMSDIRGMAVRVRSENTSSQDVTEQYTDLNARLSNAQATEKEYLALLNKATDVEDIVKIYSYLSQVRQEIEQLKTQMLNIERTTAMSLISVSLSPETSAKALVKAGWNPIEIFKGALRGIVVFGQVLGSILIWVLIFIPVWGTVLGIILWRRHKRQQSS